MAKSTKSKKIKYVYQFGNKKADGNGSMKPLLGGKGANLAEMANLGLPVPPGFTIPTSVCTYFYAHEKTYPKELKAQVEKALDHVGKLTGKSFGDSKNPLLVSVRSGGRASMAKVIIGGQMLCLLLTLLVTPVSYAIFDDWGKGKFFRRRQPHS